MLKKVVAVLLGLLMIATGTLAERTVVTSMASEVNPNHLISVAVDAKISGYDPIHHTVGVTILIPERYRPDEILSLKVGDGIYTQGREITIRSISEDEGYLVLNAGQEDEVYLFESVDLNYWIMDVNDNTWVELATVNVPMSDRLLFLDEINPVTGEGLLYSTVHNQAEFLAQMKVADDPGFDRRNVKAVFDETGELALIRRIYVPWQ